MLCRVGRHGAAAGAAHVGGTMAVDPAGTPLGTFVHRPAEDRWTWSDELFAIHGFAPGEVVPTSLLVESHRHPEDRARVRDQIDDALRTGRPTAGQHRILDTLGGERWVAMLVQPHDTDGSVWLEGHVLDLTVAHTRSAARLANDMLVAATESRTAIDLAKGALVLAYGVTPESAFELLRWYSQHTQVRLRTLAEQVVAAARRPGTLTATARRRLDGALATALRSEAGGTHFAAGPPDPTPGPVGDARAVLEAAEAEPAVLRTDVVHLPGATFVQVTGDVDLRTTPALTDAIGAAIERTAPPAPVVVDLTEVGHLGPTGVAALVAGHRRCRAAATDLRLVVRPGFPALLGDAGLAVFTDLASAAA